MASTNYALRVNAPTSTATNVTVATATTTAGSISVRVWMKSDVKTHIRFGSTTVGACTTTDMYLTADIDYVFDIPPAVTNATVKRSSTSGILRWAAVA
jgi:hypothetical protein